MSQVVRKLGGIALAGATAYLTADAASESLMYLRAKQCVFSHHPPTRLPSWVGAYMCCSPRPYCTIPVQVSGAAAAGGATSARTRAGQATGAGTMVQLLGAHQPQRAHGGGHHATARGAPRIGRACAPGAQGRPATDASVQPIYARVGGADDGRTDRLRGRSACVCAHDAAADDGSRVRCLQLRRQQQRRRRNSASTSKQQQRRSCQKVNLVNFSQFVRCCSAAALLLKQPNPAIRNRPCLPHTLVYARYHAPALGQWRRLAPHNHRPRALQLLERCHC